MRTFAILPLLVFASLGAARGQDNAVPTLAEARKLNAEIVDLMSTAGVVVPELSRAGAPLIENVRQAAKTLEAGGNRDHVGVLYVLLTNVKVYLQLVDALPKTPAFSAAVRKQIEAVREKTDLVESYFRNELDRREFQLRDPDRDNLKRYSEANSTLGAPAANENRVIFLGDSITDGWPINQYFPGKPYVNRGIGGQITGQMLGRMRADVLAHRPAAIVLLGGTNDLARGVSPDAIQHNIAMIAELTAAAGAAPVIASILPVSDYHAARDPRFKRTPDRPLASIVALNRWIRQYCEARSFVFLDYYGAVVDAQGMLQTGLADDGLHPNAEGYKVMAPLAEQAIAAALKGRRPTQSRDRKRFGVF